MAKLNVIGKAKFSMLHKEVDFFDRFSVIGDDDFDVYLEKKIGGETPILSRKFSPLLGKPVVPVLDLNKADKINLKRKKKTETQIILDMIKKRK